MTVSYKSSQQMMMSVNTHLTSNHDSCAVMKFLRDSYIYSGNYDKILSENSDKILSDNCDNILSDNNEGKLFGDYDYILSVNYDKIEIFVGEVLSCKIL